MKRMFRQNQLIVIVFFALPLWFSCKKDAVQAPAFSPTGYWIGSFFSGATLAILNRPDGSSRIYLLTTGGVDTASNNVKLDGNYSLDGGVFAGNYIDSTGTGYINIESTRTGSNYMDGVFSLNSFTTSGNIIETFNFEVVRH